MARVFVLSSTDSMAFVFLSPMPWTTWFGRWSLRIQICTCNVSENSSGQKNKTRQQQPSRALQVGATGIQSPFRIEAIGYRFVLRRMQVSSIISALKSFKFTFTKHVRIVFQEIPTILLPHSRKFYWHLFVSHNGLPITYLKHSPTGWSQIDGGFRPSEVQAEHSRLKRCRNKKLDLHGPRVPKRLVFYPNKQRLGIKNIVLTYTY